MELAAVSEDLRPRVIAKVARWCGDRELAEESTQEALARAVVWSTRLNDPDRLYGWLVRVAMNLVRNQHRRTEVARRHTPMLLDPAHGPREEFDAVEDAMLVHDLMAGLTPSQRTVVSLRYFGGYTVAEAADTLGCPEGTVKSLTHRAVATMRRGVAESG